MKKSEPLFKTDDCCTYFLTVLLIHPEWRPDHLSDQNSKLDKDESAQGAQGAQVSAQGAQALSKEQRAILTLCKQPKSRAEILAGIKLTNHRKNYLRHIVPLMEAGIIEMTIPETPTHMHQKYVLTEKGQAILNQLNR